MPVNQGEWSGEKFRVGDAELHVIKGGSGKPLIVFHGELGNPGWLRWHREIARNRTLWIPLHPGFGRSPRAEWIDSMRDLACFYARFIRERGMGPVDVIGFSLGGWLAAEMAVNDARQFSRMVLVAPAGIRPPEGEIMDMFTMTARTYLSHHVIDPHKTSEFGSLFGGESTVEQFEGWEDARAETARLAWKPYLFNMSLPNLLEGIEAPPTLLLWGRQDQVIPLSAGESYSRFIGGSKLVTFDNCGHMPEVEKTDEFIREVENFLA